jgi:hypothetical protein
MILCFQKTARNGSHLLYNVDEGFWKSIEEQSDLYGLFITHRNLLIQYYESLNQIKSAIVFP